MKKIILMLSVMAAFACTKTIDKDLPSNEMSLLELRIKGQMGVAVIERTHVRASATVYVMAEPGYPYAAVPVESIVVSRFASASVEESGTLNFNNPERKAKITVTSESGKSMDWWVYLKQYDAFYVGTWKVVDCKLCCNQRVAGAGDGAWETQLSGSEFASYGLPEYDNTVTITMDKEMSGNNLVGKIVHDAGNDGLYGNFYGVLAPYSVEAPLDMNPRLRHLLPPGESDWELDLTTNQMRITKDNVTSTMFFGDDQYGNKLFRFTLPDAGQEPSRDGFYDNMWRSSVELYYAMFKID